MLGKFLGTQKFSFRHIRNLSALHEGLEGMIEKMRIRRKKRDANALIGGSARTYHPIGLDVRKVQ